MSALRQLWSTSPQDLVTFGTVSLTILLVGLLACSIPARRAMRIEPVAALRQD